MIKYMGKTVTNEDTHDELVHVRVQVLTAASMKIAVFWVLASCSLVEVYRRFRGACCLHRQGGHHPEQAPLKRR
jgi:hypothetical protein